MVADEVLTEIRGPVMVITLNRPEAMNAVNLALANQLAAALEALDADPDLSVGVLHGGDAPGFCAGMDLKEFVSGSTPYLPERGFGGIAAKSADKPLIAAIDGFALAGGLEIALSCDLLVASRGAQLGIPEVGVGLFAAGGALSRLPRRIPYGTAMQMALTGEPILAEQAVELGLIQALTDPGEALDGALELAERVAINAPLGLMASKKLIRELGGLDDGYWAEQQPILDAIVASADATEGATAFADRRPARWTGR